MDIATLFKKLTGIGGDTTAPPMPGAPQDTGGVGGLLAGHPMQDAAAPGPAAQPPAAISPAGPQPAAAPPAASSTPPTPAGGVGDFLSHMLQKAMTRGDDGMSLLDSIGQLGSHITDMNGFTKGAEAEGATQAAARVADGANRIKRQQLMDMGRQLGMGDRERLMFTADPEAWVKANESRFGYHDQAPSSTGYYGEPGQPGSQTITAPAAPDKPEKPDDPLHDQLVQAQIQALVAQAGLRGNQGDYYGAKAKQPYAPPRAGAGGVARPKNIVRIQ